MSDQNLVKFKIDGIECEASTDKTILEVCREKGVHIPTLCYDPSLPPYGSCLLCVVEIEGMNKLSLSCTTKVGEGLKVLTNTKIVMEARKNALEMLVSNHHADCRGPCYQKCPAHVDVQRYLTYAKDGKFLEALSTVNETNPFPMICGRVCVRYCEAACRRNDIDSPVAANFIKRYAADMVSDSLPFPMKPQSNGKKVAVIGGGPGGLTATYFLAKKGYEVKVFDRHPKLGGMLRYGIPDYRLPQNVLDKEILRITSLGVEVETGKSWGEDFTLKELKDQGYESIFVTIGAQGAKKMRIGNEDNKSVESGIGFLERVKKQGPPDLRGTVLVVGGGNTAVDAARTAIRTGANEVRILYRRTRAEMPADEIEIIDALEEGVQIDYLVAPLEVVADGDDLKALKCQKMMLGEPDASGRRRPVVIEGSDYEITCNYIISAIGQDVQGFDIKDESLGKLKVERWGNIYVDPITYATSIEGVFAAGDGVTGPMAAIDAIGAGKKCSDIIDNYLNTGKIQNPHYEFISRKENLGEIPKHYFETFEKSERSKMRQTDPFQRIQNFEEVDLGLKEKDVCEEASRCLTCGCSDVYTCDLKKYCTEYNVTQTKFKGGKANKYEEDTSHKHVRLEPNKCILCGKCVRTCEKVLGVSALGYVGRGNDMIVKPAMGKQLKDTNCIGCGNCISVCPTGAITYNVEQEMPWFKNIKTKSSICNNCGKGCELVFKKNDADYWYIKGKEYDDLSSAPLCERGRFFQRPNLMQNRLKTPFIKDNNLLSKVSLSEALDKTYKGIEKLVKKHGPESVAVLVSPRSTNEEIFMANHLAKKGIGTNNIASLYDLEARDPSWPEDFMKGLYSTADHEDFRNADALVLINSDIYRDNPVLGFQLVNSFNEGKDIVVISSVSTKTTRFATDWINNRRGTTSALLYEALRRGIDRVGIEKVKKQLSKIAGGEKFLKEVQNLKGDLCSIAGIENSDVENLSRLIFDESKKVVFVYNPLSNLDQSYGDLLAVFNVLMSTGKMNQKGNGILLSHHQANMQGYYNLGAYPTLENKLPGAKSAHELKEMFEKGKIKGTVIFGEDPYVDKKWGNIMNRMDFISLMDMYNSATLDHVDVGIPSTGYAESSGSITTQENKVKSFAPVFNDKLEMQGHELLSNLSSKFSDESYSFSKIREEMVKNNKSYSIMNEVGDDGRMKLNTKDSTELHFFPVTVSDSPLAHRRTPSFSTISKLER